MSLFSQTLLFLRLLKTVLINVTETRRHKVLVVIGLLTIWHIRRTIELRRRQKEKLVRRLREQGNISDNSGPLITFSGGGMLGFYYSGVSAYLTDNFTLDNCKFAGISAGTSTASALSLQLPVEAIIICGLRWFKSITATKFGTYFMNPNKFIQLSTQLCDEFNISEEMVQRRNSENSPYYGATNISVFPWKHEIFSNFETREEGFYCMSCSMRVLPFFRSPGYYKKKFLLDGIFSALFSIPIEYYDIDDQNSNNSHKIIYVTPVSRIKYADIKPNGYKKSECFRWYDVFRVPNLNGIYNQFERGYKDAMQARKKLIAKGLIPKQPQSSQYNTPRDIGDIGIRMSNNNNNNNDNFSENYDSKSSENDESESDIVHSNNSRFFETGGNSHSNLFKKCRHCGTMVKYDTSNLEISSNVIDCKKCGNIDKLTHWLEYLRMKGPEVMYDENVSDFRDLIKKTTNEKNDKPVLPISAKSMRRLLRSEWEKDDLQPQEFNDDFI